MGHMTRTTWLAMVNLHVCTKFGVSSSTHHEDRQEGQHLLTGQRAANYTLLANQWAERRLLRYEAKCVQRRCFQLGLVHLRSGIKGTELPPANILIPLERQLIALQLCHWQFLANVNSRSRSLYAVARPSIVCLSVTLVHPTQAVEIFSNISMAFGTWPSIDTYWKFHGDRPRGTPPPGELNTRGVAKYSDFGPIDGCISETVQDRR